MEALGILKKWLGGRGRGPDKLRPPGEDDYHLASKRLVML